MARVTVPKARVPALAWLCRRRPNSGRSSSVFTARRARWKATMCRKNGLRVPPLLPLRDRPCRSRPFSPFANRGAPPSLTEGPFSPFGNGGASRLGDACGNEGGSARAPSSEPSTEEQGRSLACHVGRHGKCTDIHYHSRLGLVKSNLHCFAIFFQVFSSWFTPGLAVQRMT